MNERIRQLAEQCRIEEYNQHGDLIEFGFNEEKFAQLIVAECIGKIELEAVQYAEPVWAFEIVNDIREHFGVEE